MTVMPRGKDVKLVRRSVFAFAEEASISREVVECIWRATGIGTILVVLVQHIREFAEREHAV